MDLELDYPDDDLDAMLDQELDVMSELEKENAPARPTASLGGMKTFEGNVGIGGSKRQRSAGDMEEEAARSKVLSEFRASVIFLITNMSK